MSEDKDTIMW